MRGMIIRHLGERIAVGETTAQETAAILQELEAEDAIEWANQQILQAQRFYRNGNTIKACDVVILFMQTAAVCTDHFFKEVKNSSLSFQTILKIFSTFSFFSLS